MPKPLSMLIQVLLVSCLWTARSGAQHMYLDTDGDGLSTSADVTKASGITSITIWLDSNHDRNGILQTCNSHTGAKYSTTRSSALDVFSYTIFLKAVGGTVKWGSFLPADPAYESLGAPSPTETDIELNYFRTSGVTPAGQFKVGTIQVSVLSGEPQIVISQGKDINPYEFGTHFGCPCSGSILEHSYVAGDPSNARAPHDWSDTDGLRPALASDEAPPAPSFIAHVGPSPSTSTASISFKLRTSATVDLTVYGLKGQMVRILTRGQLDAGSYSFVWDGTDAKGNRAAAGVYIFRLAANGVSVDSRKVVLIR